MDRRGFLLLAGLGGLAGLIERAGLAYAGDPPADAEPFSWDALKARAKTMAAAPYDPKFGEIDPALAALDYDQYRNINFRADKAIWRERGGPVQMQLFHSGYLYREPVHIYLVENGKAARIRYDKSMFDFGPAEKRPKLPDDAAFSGLRLHAPVMQADEYSEYALFQGASYFRGRAKGQTYGLSARGLAVDTAQQVGEDFPAFTDFWVETPPKESTAVTVYALLDSKSATGAFRFVIDRRVDVVMDTTCEICPRRPLTHAGIAPFSSMFFFGPADPTYHDDFRPRVYDSDGLVVATGDGNWIWRPIVTANHILYSVFSDKSPKGFGLMQRDRNFDHYQDLNAGYERRPSAWVEPTSDWGEGSVDLIELPTDTEYADNIVAFWRPKEPLQPGRSYGFGYKLTWCWYLPVKRELGEVIMTRTGKGIPPGSRYFLIDFAGGELYAGADDELWDYDVGASAGAVKAFTVVPNPMIDGKRVGIEYHPGEAKVADLHFQVRRFGKPLGERWVYRFAV
jgi:periplasmic glucans biosynthesis protein